MSSNQKMLKIMSFIAIIAAFGMGVWTYFSIMFANTPQGLLLAISAVIPCVLDVLLGCYGIGAANKPALSCGTIYIAMYYLAAVLNVVAAGIYILIGGMPVPSIINCIVVLVYCYFAQKVRQEALR